MNKRTPPQFGGLHGPPAPSDGYIPVSVAAGYGYEWVSHADKRSVFGISHTYAVTGTVGVPSGATNYLSPWFMTVPDYQSCVLWRVWTLLRSGSLTVDIQCNGVVIPGLSGQVIGTSKSTITLAAPLGLSDGDEILINPTAGTGDGLTVTFSVYYQEG